MAVKTEPKMKITASGKIIGKAIERQRRKKAKEIGDRLRRARKARQLLQSEVAEACAVTSTSVSNWENGSFMIDDIRLERAAARLGVSVEWLKTGDPSKAPILRRGRPSTRRSSKEKH